MVDDAEAAQAEVLLRELHLQIGNLERRLDVVEKRGRRSSERGLVNDHRQLAALRQGLSEAHYLVARLHRRFPETVCAQRTSA
ncbi:MAG: hypothetical protein M3O32_16380 [Actinomycetota bacterium]|nr:hypothetical protein [Actinomycetota bacterium]